MVGAHASPVPDHANPAPRLWVGFAFAAFVPIGLIVLGLWLGTAYRHNAEALTATSASLRQVSETQALFAAVKDAQSQERGYALTGDPLFKASYARASRAVPARLAALKQAAVDAPARARLAHIDALTARMFVKMQQVIDARDESGLAAAAARVSARRSALLINAVGAEIDAMVLEHNRKAAASQRIARDRGALSTLIYWWLVVLLSLVAFSAAYLLWSSRRARYAARRAADESLKRQAALFENTFNAVILIAPDGRIEIINGAAERLFGYTKAEVLQRDIGMIADIAPGEGAFLDRMGLSPDGLARPLRPHVEAKRKDGSTLVAEVALGTMPQDDGTHIVVAMRDVTEREKVEKLKDAFLSTISHELRTPLTSILGSLGLLRGGAVGALPQPALQLVGMAEANATRLLRIVGDLLDVEKIRSGEMTFAFDAIDLRDAAQKAVDLMDGLPAANGITLLVEAGDDPVMVSGDAARLVQVAANLLSNAIKFSPGGSTVIVSTDVVEDEARLAIADQGPGIDGELRDRLFTRFAQSMQPSFTPGTGLGLAISREIVERHDGRIWFEDAPGGGSIFIVAMPLWEDADDQPLSAARSR